MWQISIIFYSCKFGTLVFIFYKVSNLLPKSVFLIFLIKTFSKNFIQVPFFLLHFKLSHFFSCAISFLLSYTLVIKSITISTSKYHPALFPILFLRKKIHLCHHASRFRLKNSPKPSKNHTCIFLPLALTMV